MQQDIAREFFGARRLPFPADSMMYHIVGSNANQDVTDRHANSEFPVCGEINRKKSMCSSAMTWGLREVRSLCPDLNKCGMHDTIQKQDYRIRSQCTLEIICRIKSLARSWANAEKPHLQRYCAIYSINRSVKAHLLSMSMETCMISYS